MALSTISGVGAGSSGTILTTTNPKSGNVIQVVSADYGTEISTTSTSFSDTGLTATITPTFATSKILVMVCQNGLTKYDSAGGNAVLIRLYRNGSFLFYINDLASFTGATTVANSATSVNYLDSPATTSALTYKTQFAARVSGSQSLVQSYGAQAGGTRSTITIMEIAA